MNPKIATQLGSWSTLTYLQLTLIIQVLGLGLQYAVASRFLSNPVSELFYAISVANLAILMIRYLSGESEKRQKLMLFSAAIQGLLLGCVLVLPALVLPFVSEPSKGRLVTVVMMFAIGSMFEIATQTQKKIIINFNNRKLTTDGMFRYVRHPELIGAVTKYAAFLALPHIPYLYILPLILALVLIPSTIQLRNQKLSQKEGWSSYEQQTHPLVPKFSKSDTINYGLIGIFALFLIADYSVGGFATTLKGAKFIGKDL